MQALIFDLDGTARGHRLRARVREDELTRAGAFRVYREPEELRDSLDELGVGP